MIPSKPKLRALLQIGLVANLLEFYDFTVFGYLAATIAPLFFETAHPTTALIQGFLVFASSYLVRPLGAFYFGQLSDRRGRKIALQRSLWMVAIPSVLIGCLPTLHQIGPFAGLLLVSLRLMQGFGMGGELMGNGCYLFESAPSRKMQSILCSLPTVSSKLGMLMASLVTAFLFYGFDSETIQAWAWRLPFYLGIPIAGFIWYCRRFILEPPQAEFHSESISVKTTTWRAFWSVIPIIAFMQVFGFLVVFWLPSYLTHFLGYSKTQIQFLNTINALLLAFSCFIAGFIASRVRYVRLIQFGVIGIIVSIIPFINLLQNTSYSIILMVGCALSLLLGALSGVSVQLLGDQFPRSLRGRGMNLSFMLPAAIVGGTAPAVCSYFTDSLNLPLFPAYYILFFGLLALPAALRLKVKSDSSLH